MNKRITILTLVVCLLSYSLNAQQTDKFRTNMLPNIDRMDTTWSMSGFQELGNTFERIANAEPEQWLPAYYASYCVSSQIYFVENVNQVDDLLDKADELLERAETLMPDEPEIWILQARINQSRISVDPQTRGAQYGPVAGQLLAKALEASPDNPRAHYLKGSNLYFTPAMWGGGADKALPILETAVEKFKSFAYEDELWPRWGAGGADWMLGLCKDTIEKEKNSNNE